LDTPGRTQRRIALVEDDSTTRKIMRAWIAATGLQTVEFDRGKAVIEAGTKDLAAVCLDLGLEDMPGLHVLQHLHAQDPDLPIIVVTAERTLETAVEAMRAGAYDYVTKPVEPERLAQAVRRAIERRELGERVRHLTRELDTQKGLGAILGESAPTRELVRQIERVIGSDVAVCVLGESGTGKELVARAIHQHGARGSGPFVAINCAAVPSSLQESELFGHEKGAFTGALTTRKGRFEQADGGTLFLDELGEMSPGTQAALLRTLQEKTLVRVGGASEIPIDVRIVAATHRDLEAEVRAGRFREDLYFRLVVYPIQVPPLRERADDIPLLVGHFLRKFSSEGGRSVPRVTTDALDALMRYRWPGNVRELMNVVHRGLLTSDGSELRLADLPASIKNGTLPELPRADGRVELSADAPILPLRELEARAIERAIEASGGSITKAAKLLGMGRATLYRRLAEDGRLEKARMES
jgi:DNA-binding NtrC family response regulator